MASENCRDELNYARSLGKSRLLVYLTDMTLPAGMDMRLNRLQAVYWSRFRTTEEAYEDILYLDFAYAGGETSVCQIGFTDGGHTEDAYVSNMWENIAVMTIEWKNEQRPYNGRMESFQVRGYLHVGFYSTYPYGFVLDDGENLYFYQSPIG